MSVLFSCEPLLMGVVNLLIIGWLPQLLKNIKHWKYWYNFITFWCRNCQQAFVYSYTACDWPLRSGKNTHISIINNSVTHLWSHMNSAITDIAGNSAPSVNIAMPSAEPSAGIVGSNGNCLSVSWCFAMLYKCFMMFY